MQIHFGLNGHGTDVDIEPSRPLIDVLRDDLGLTGTKKGCDYEGQCGTCTVIIDGRAVRACRVEIGDVADKQVLTIEGLAESGFLHPLQQAFVNVGAVQCGFCTPGMIMSAKALLDREPAPSRADVKRALQGNLCRCTGYVTIVEAVMQAAAMLRGESPLRETPAAVVGGDARRLEAVANVTGTELYAGDMTLPGMLYAKVARSGFANARIVAVDTQAARSVPGVVGVFTAADIPGVKSFDSYRGSRAAEGYAPQASVAYQPVLAEARVRMVGEPIAMVVASSEGAAQAGCDAVKVVYQPEEPTFDPEAVLRAGESGRGAPGDIFEREQVVIGNAQSDLEGADVVVQTEYRMCSLDYATLEPHSMLAYIDGDGRVVVVGPTHQPHARQQQIAEMLAIPPSRVRVMVPQMGGSFGGRHHFWPVVAIALPAFLTRRPVRLVYSRGEVFQATQKRHAFRIRTDIAARGDGRLVGMRVRALGNAGAYGGAPEIARDVALAGTGPYAWQSLDYDCIVAHTNWPSGGAFRGYGMPQGVLGLECALDELALRLNLDPWDLRRRNAIDGNGRTPTGQAFDEPFAFVQVLEAVRPEWHRLRAERDALRAGGLDGTRVGVGLAAAWYQFGKGGTLRSDAKVGLENDGRVTLYYSVQKSGQGLDTVMSQLASQELGIPRQEINLVNGDTDLTPDSGVTGACRSTYWVGGAIQQASRHLKQAIIGTASEMLNAAPDRLLLCDGGVRVRGGSGASVTLREVAAELDRIGAPRHYSGALDLEDRYPAASRPKYLGHFVAGVALAQVKVDVRTGKVAVVKMVVAQDVGRAINPQDLKGQIEGAAVMELGASLMEEFIPGETLDFKSYRIPRLKDVPEIGVILVEVPGKDGPHGAKGAGEAVMGHTRAAILNAVTDATGKRLRQLPLTPERVLAALKAD